MNKVEQIYQNGLVALDKIYEVMESKKKSKGLCQMNKCQNPARNGYKYCYDHLKTMPETGRFKMHPPKEGIHV